MVQSDDKIFRDNEEGTCILIDVAILGDRNVVEKGKEKVLKLANLTITKQSRQVECKKILVIIVQLEASQGHPESV